MNISRKAMLTGLAVVAMGLSATASAHDRRDHRHWKHDRHHPHFHGRHHDRYVVRPYAYAPAYVARERVIVQRPVYVTPPVPYYDYPPVYRPGVVVSVDIPPLVIPIR